MMTWYAKSLGDGMTYGASAAEIEEVYGKLFAVSQSPTAAVFTRPESEDRLHCEVIAYFSPAAIELAKRFDAEPCAKPNRTGLSLLAGEAASWSELFPDEE
jgi:hypothetical protein